MIILVDKPIGVSSFDVVRTLKKQYNTKKIGHSGTLDPMASGLLVIGINEGTKQLNEITGLDKEYIAEIDFSKKTDTWDLEYWKYFEQLNNKDINIPTKEDIQAKIKQLIPIYNLPLPYFCAKKIDGKKMYEYARNGELLERYEDMQIKNVEILDYKFPILKIKINVGSGCFIRSIAHWLGKQFDLGGILVSLKRTKIGEFCLENASSIEVSQSKIKNFAQKLENIV